MHTTSSLQLEQLQVASPCTANWDAMAGDERVRFCGQCERHVYDLSTLTTEAAVQLVSQTEGRMCVRFLRRHDGTVITQDCPVGLTKRQRKGKWLATGLAGLLTLATGGWLASAGATAIDQQLASVPGAVESQSQNTTQIVAASVRSFMTQCWEFVFPSPAPPTVVMGQICLPPPPPQPQTP